MPLSHWSVKTVLSAIAVTVVHIISFFFYFRAFAGAEGMLYSSYLCVRTCDSAFMIVYT